MRPQGAHRGKKRCQRHLLAIAADVATAASICYFLGGVEELHRFAPTLVHIPYLRIDRLDAVTAVRKSLEGALQPTPIDFGFVREAIGLVEIIVANRQILGNSPQVVLTLLE